MFPQPYFPSDQYLCRCDCSDGLLFQNPMTRPTLPLIGLPWYSYPNLNQSHSSMIACCQLANLSAVSLPATVVHQLVLCVIPTSSFLSCSQRSAEGHIINPADRTRFTCLKNDKNPLCLHHIVNAGLLEFLFFFFFFFFYLCIGVSTQLLFCLLYLNGAFNFQISIVVWSSPVMALPW